MNFLVFKQAVANQFQLMQQHHLFRSKTPKDDLWATYLASFPEGTNPIYRERTEHDCNCCKNFIRNAGNVLAIIDGKIVSIWDFVIDDSIYGPVAKALSALVHAHEIDNVFLTTERTAGVDKNFEQLLDGQKQWNHLFVNFPSKVIEGFTQIGPKLGSMRAMHDVLARGLTTLTDDAIDTVLELIKQNSLYRGQEFEAIVKKFKELKQAYDGTDIFVWSNTVSGTPAVNTIRNSAIGTLLIDLSEGVDLEQAVKSFEAKVAPTNYKRPTALVTKSMIEAAKKTIEELGLTSALERRYATINDIALDNIIFANRSARSAITGDVFSELAGDIKANTKQLSKVEEIGIDDFIKNIVPSAKSIELLVENRHAGNLVSLITAVDPTAQDLFKWSNKFSWSYAGNVTDSIKERVKAAGGNVTGDLCCRLAWDYSDDLDFHMYEPNGEHIYYGNRRQLSSNGGMLDVDANGADGIRPHPVENIFYAKESKMREGVYKLVVNNYSRRSDGRGFEVEIDFKGKVYHFAYENALPSNAKVVVAEFNYSKKDGITFIKSLEHSETSKEIWGLSTGTFRQVNVLMQSPNHWGNAIGNKHYFFMLDGCVNQEEGRGFYNEFIREDLNVHRKVIEMVGSKLKTEKSENQLSGLGFSSTQPNSVLCRVTGSFTRTVKIVF